MKSPETSELVFELEATRKDDVKVPVTITVAFPKGYGLTAAKTLERLVQTKMNAIYNELVNIYDAETVAAIMSQRDENDAD